MSLLDLRNHTHFFIVIIQISENKSGIYLCGNVMFRGDRSVTMLNSEKVEDCERQRHPPVPGEPITPRLGGAAEVQMGPWADAGVGRGCHRGPWLAWHRGLSLLLLGMGSGWFNSDTE